ncbi:MAG: permease prefix domain 1-containing protein [Candidatus Hydrogenedentales bacterium]|jgi:hypothetical protein
MITRLRDRLWASRLPHDFGLCEDYDLTEWLSKATEGLCVEARERIETEVRRHIAETAAELEAEGMSAVEAFDAALRQLGSAKVARRGFVRTNLTQAEYELLMKHTASRPDPAKAHRSELLLGFAILYELWALRFFLGPVLRSGENIEWESLLFAQSVVAMFLAVYLDCRFRACGARRKVIGTRLFSCIAWSMALPYYFKHGLAFSEKSEGLLLTGFAVLVGILWGLVRFGALWWKLGRVSIPATPEN